jgi:hypothetical protein
LKCSGSHVCCCALAGVTTAAAPQLYDVAVTTRWAAWDVQKRYSDFRALMIKVRAVASSGARTYVRSAASRCSESRRRVLPRARAGTQLEDTVPEATAHGGHFPGRVFIGARDADVISARMSRLARWLSLVLALPVVRVAGAMTEFLALAAHAGDDAAARRGDAASLEAYDRAVAAAAAADTAPAPTMTPQLQQVTPPVTPSGGAARPALLERSASSAYSLTTSAAAAGAAGVPGGPDSPWYTRAWSGALRKERSASSFISSARAQTGAAATTVSAAAPSTVNGDEPANGSPRTTAPASAPQRRELPLAATTTLMFGGAAAAPGGDSSAVLVLESRGPIRGEAPAELPGAAAAAAATPGSGAAAVEPVTGGAAEGDAAADVAPAAHATASHEAAAAAAAGAGAAAGIEAAPAAHGEAGTTAAAAAPDAIDAAVAGVAEAGGAADESGGVAAAAPEGVVFEEHPAGAGEGAVSAAVAAPRATASVALADPAVATDPVDAVVAVAALGAAPAAEADVAVVNADGGRGAPTGGASPDVAAASPEDAPHDEASAAAEVADAAADPDAAAQSPTDEPRDTDEVAGGARVAVASSRALEEAEADGTAAVKAVRDRASAAVAEIDAAAEGALRASHTEFCHWHCVRFGAVAGGGARAGALKLSGDTLLRDAVIRLSLGVLLVLFCLWLSDGFGFRHGHAVEL